MYLYRPTSVAYHRKTGRWWHVTYGGVHLPPIGGNASVPAAMWSAWNTAGPEDFAWYVPPMSGDFRSVLVFLSALLVAVNAPRLG
jgi:hypothetical protein